MQVRLQNMVALRKKQSSLAASLHSKSSNEGEVRALQEIQQATSHMLSKQLAAR